MGCGASAPPPPTAEEYTKAVKDLLVNSLNLTIAELGKKGGFFNNAALKIPIPTVLGEIMASARDLPGIGEKVVEFEQKLNSCAEQAANASAAVFNSAIQKFGFPSAKEIILAQKMDAATVFLKTNHTQDLKTAFKPVIDKELADSGLASLLDAIMAGVDAAERAKNAVSNAAGAVGNALGGLFGAKEEKKPEPPAKEAPKVDLNEYLTTKALDGFWATLVRKEENVRTQTQNYTPMMNKCFGSGRQA